MHAVTAKYCMVEGCSRPPVTKETYAGKDGDIIDEVCSGHTGRLGLRLPMVGNDPVVGEVAYKIGME